MSGYQLRSYQREAVDRGVAYLTNPALRGRNGIIVAPTGSGKSLIIAGIATALPGPCVVFQPTREILQQNAAKLAAYGYKPALYSASVGRKEIGTITLATIGSVVHHLEAFRQFPYVLIDECHLVNPKTIEQADGSKVGGMYREFLVGLEQARILGLTATPFRLASNSYGSILRFLTRTRPRIFRDVVHVTQVRELLDAGYLAPVEYRQRPVIKRERLRLNSTGADYTDASVQLAFREVGFESKLQREVESLLAAGRRNVLVFTRFVAEAEQLAKAIPGAAVVTGETPMRERARILEDFKAGRTKVCSNVSVLSVGFDFPELETVVLASPTVSLARYYQEVGRAIRPSPGKASALVVDLVGLVEQFGRVEDLVLEPGGKKGDLWVVRSKGRDLTNAYFGEPDPKRQAKASYWSGAEIERVARTGSVRSPGERRAVLNGRLTCVTSSSTLMEYSTPPPPSRAATTACSAATSWTPPCSRGSIGSSTRPARTS
jgi:DNA repair protein RadD